MRRKWKRVLVVICTALLLVTMPEIRVLADEIQEKETTVLDCESIGLGSEDSAEMDADFPANEELVGREEITVGDGVTATFDEETGAVEFYSNGGMLWRKWVDKLNINVRKIKSIKVASGKVFLPDDSVDPNKDWDQLQLFGGLTFLEKIDLRGFDTSKMTDMSGMFDGCYALTEVDVSGFNTSNVTNMRYMFGECYSLTKLDVTNFNTSSVTNMYGMFAGCTQLTKLDVTRFDISNVTDTGNMFSSCYGLTELDLGGFDTSNVTNMKLMFYSCNSLQKLDLSNFITSNVTNMWGMFEECSNLTELNISSFDTSHVEEYGQPFKDCSSLRILKTPKKNSMSCDLPLTMYDELGNKYTKLPTLSKSITLTKEKPVIIPTPTPTTKPVAKGFSDVQNPKHAYYNAIYWAAEAGITKGYPDGTFGIDRSCTRGEMMMFLWRYADQPAPKNVLKSPFKDVPKSHTFYKAILWGSQKGITKGYTDGTFGIDRNVSRGECMMFLWRLKGKPAPKAVLKSPFTDVSKNHVFYNAILWGSQKKITTGYTSGAKKGTFGINENCTRGQIVTFLYRAK